LTDSEIPSLRGIPIATRVCGTWIRFHIPTLSEAEGEGALLQRECVGLGLGSHPDPERSRRGGSPIATRVCGTWIDLLQSPLERSRREPYHNDALLKFLASRGRPIVTMMSTSTECRNDVTRVAQPPSAVMLRLPLARHPEPRQRPSALISARVGVRDPVFGFS